MPATLLLTEPLADQLATAVEQGVPIETAAQAAGISRQTFYEWLQAAERGTWQAGNPVDPESQRRLLAFSNKIRRAQARHEQAVLERIQAAVETTNAKTGVPEWRAGAWLLNNHPRYRERYRQHRETTVNQQVPMTVVGQLSCDVKQCDMRYGNTTVISLNMLG